MPYVIVYAKDNVSHGAPHGASYVVSPLMHHGANTTKAYPTGLDGCTPWNTAWDTLTMAYT